MASATTAGDPADKGSSLPPLELGDLSMPMPSGDTPTQPKAAAPTQLTTNTGAVDPPFREVEAELEESDTVPTTIPTLSRQDTSAIGPATDLPTPMLEAPPSVLAAGPVIQFTLLLPSTGTRHPFQLNEKYLTRRNVKAQGEDGNFDPGVISVYTLKELILKDWRDDWDARPSSPSAIRLISFGQLLADNVSLKDCKLSTNGSPNVLHMTIKPQDVVEEEEAGKGGKASHSRDRDGGRSGGCRCVIL